MSFGYLLRRSLAAAGKVILDICNFLGSFGSVVQRHTQLRSKFLGSLGIGLDGSGRHDVFFLDLNFLEFIDDESPGLFRFLEEPFEVNDHFRYTVFQILPHLLLLGPVVVNSVELLLQLLFFFTWQIMHMVLDRLNSPVYLNLEIYILILQAYNGLL